MCPVSQFYDAELQILRVLTDVCSQVLKLKVIPLKKGRTAPRERRPQGGKRNPEARKLWRQYLRETDPTSREMLYQAYLKALNKS